MSLFRHWAPSAVIAVGLLLAPITASALVIAGPFGVEDIDPDSSAPLEVTFNVDETGIIASLKVSLEIEAYWDNIFVSLSHLGTEVILMDFQSDMNDSDSILDVTFMDGAPVLEADCNDDPCTGTYAPLQSLSAFNGMELSGDWIFTFYDNAGFSGDGSVLLSSSLEVTTTTSVPEPATMALFGIGLAGLGFARRRRAA